MSWLFSKPLAVQLVVVLVGAIVFSQIVSFFLFVNERRIALRDASIYQAVFRTATIARTLQATEANVDRQIIRISSSRRWRYWISETAAVTEPEDLPHRERASLALQERYPDIAAGLLFQRGAGALPPSPRRLPVTVQGGTPRENTQRPQPRPIITVSIPIAENAWLNGVALQLPSAPPFGWRPAASLALLFVSVVGVLLLLIGRVTRPLSALAVAADKLGRGEQVGPVPEQGPQEVRVTTRAFNSMQQRLGRFVEDRTRMLAAISHDLRTPITALRLRAEMLEEGENRDRMLETLNTMAAMTDATLNFMRDESSTEETNQVDLSALVESVCQDFRDMGKEISWRVPERLTYACRSNSLRRAVSNLIDNAVKHAATTRVVLERRTKSIDIIVADDGPGIPEDKLESVFRPFERLDDARNTEDGSAGLGLSIARSIVQAHGGDLVLRNREEGGLEARIHLPNEAL